MQSLHPFASTLCKVCIRLHLQCGRLNPQPRCLQTQHRRLIPTTSCACKHPAQTHCIPSTTTPHVFRTSSCFPLFSLSLSLSLSFICTHTVITCFLLPLLPVIQSPTVMGREATSTTAARAVPLRPKYRWDGRTVPWTDAVGHQLPAELLPVGYRTMTTWKTPTLTRSPSRTFACVYY